MDFKIQCTPHSRIYCSAAEAGGLEVGRYKTIGMENAAEP
jgi:hypothetical protein